MPSGSYTRGRAGALLLKLMEPSYSRPSRVWRYAKKAFKQDGQNILIIEMKTESLDDGD
jgi:hypothetical protein